MRTAGILAISVLGLLLSGCGRPTEIQIDNQSAADIIIDTPHPGASKAAAGEMVWIAYTQPELVLRTEDCSYAYIAQIEDGKPLEERQLIGPMLITYLTKLDRDFVLRLYNAGPDGRPSEEIVSQGWPAKPKVDCRTKG